MTDRSLRLEFIERLTTLVTAGFGLVAGLAWNDAIQQLFTTLLPAQRTLFAKFGYAIVVTLLVVFVTSRLSRAAGRLKEKLDK